MDFLAPLQSTALPTELSKDYDNISAKVVYLWLTMNTFLFCGFTMNMVLDHSTRPGLDTLEENADKKKFFAELEEGRSTPVDYSELNKKLSVTEQSPTLDTATR